MFSNNVKLLSDDIQDKMQNGLQALIQAKSFLQIPSDRFLLIHSDHHQELLVH